MRQIQVCGSDRSQNCMHEGFNSILNSVNTCFDSAHSCCHVLYNLKK
jgi:hypothetical protein